MSSTTTEPHFSGATRVSRRRATQLRFYVLDGMYCLLIEADSEEEARYLCHDLRLEFIGRCILRPQSASLNCDPSSGTLVVSQRSPAFSFQA